jgi:flagellar hook-basal body complex protein FliE
MALPAAAALQAYRLVDSGATAAAAPASGSDFSATLSRALASVVDTARGAEHGAMQAISGGGGNITDVVTAVAKAELALQTTVAVRDRVVQAYQDIMRMPI